MSSVFHIPFEYGAMEYYEFVWRFERLVKERKSENAEQTNQNGRMAMQNMGLPMAKLEGR